MSRVLMRQGANSHIKENAAKRVVGIRVSELYRRRKQAMMNWARKFNQTELERLLNGQYTRRLNSIPKPPLSRTNLIKSVIALYLLNITTQQYQNNAVHAIRRFHTAAGYQGNNRIPNARLVDFVMGLPTERLRQMNANLPFFS